MQTPGLDLALDGGERPLAATSAPRSPTAVSVRSSIGSIISLDSTGNDSDNVVGGSGEDSWSSSDGETEDDDSDDYEPDILPPPCHMLHRHRKTYKNALCEDCYMEHAKALRKAKLDVSDMDSDAAGRSENATRRRRRKREKAHGSSGTGVGGKRSRKTRDSSSESTGSSSEDRKKRRRVAGEVKSALPDSAPSPGRRLVKPHQKKAKKLVTGGDDGKSAATRLLEDTSSSESDGIGDDERGVVVQSNKGKNKRLAESIQDNQRANAPPGKQKQASKGEGSGGGGDLLGALIENPAQARRKTSSSATPSAVA
ncbi:unnamed protein product, partial [Ectocarpus sp. 8 AP-2014]